MSPAPDAQRPAADEKSAGRRGWGRLSVYGAAIYDLTAAALAMWVAVELRYILENKPPPELIPELSVLIFLLMCALSFPLHGLHRGVWRFTALNDAVRIAMAVGLANLLFIAAFFFINRGEGLPRTATAIEIPLLLAFLLGPRLAFSAWQTRGFRGALQFEDRKTPAAILVGEADELDEALRGLWRNGDRPPFRIKGLIEPGGGHAGRAIRGVPVLGDLDALDPALTRLRSAEAGEIRLVLAGEEAEAGLVNTLIKTAGRHGARLSRARPGKGPSAFSPIEAADMINRPPRAPALGRAEPLIRGKRVLVTGAGGTIGSELVRLASRLGPDRLILLDSSEANLYEIDIELREAGLDLDWRAYIGDVRDAARLAQIFQDERPQIILHAAALKHVPLQEANPVEAVRTNLEGTRLTIEAARACGAELVALISTDKAVEPSNVMGASKRAAELLAGREAARNGPTRICIVRFGNVLGSSGSVAPLFERQIEAGGPVTVTDPEATRYFMTVQEASGLVLAAAAQTSADPQRNGALYVFDMGEPVSILHLARQLIRLRGKDPDAQGAIEIIGLRPGEKRHEKLFYDHEHLETTDVESVFSVAGHVLDATFDADLEALLEAARALDREAVRDRLARLCDLSSQPPAGAAIKPQTSSPLAAK